MMSLSFVQIIIALIAFLYIFNSLNRFLKREKRHSFLKFTATIIIWLAIFLIAVFPGTFKSLLNYFGVSGEINLIIFAGFVVVFILIFRLLNIIEGIERNITEIVRKEALKEIKK